MSLGIVPLSNETEAVIFHKVQCIDKPYKTQHVKVNNLSKKFFVGHKPVYTPTNTHLYIAVYTPVYIPLCITVYTCLYTCMFSTTPDLVAALGGPKFFGCLAVCFHVNQPCQRSDSDGKDQSPTDT